MKILNIIDHFLQVKINTKHYDVTIDMLAPYEINGYKIFYI